ncbi:MAG: D-alanine--D-alanine ligase [Polyangiaceae bacterium]|nr:D-alanine--D-alanine ligase [Polyangiaceae bacterium]MCW5791611.1 D-alanine--D-alanine ligase [Polyangiaceae bacterium]
MTLRVGVVAGGPSGEAAVSRASGRAVAEALTTAGLYVELFELEPRIAAELLAADLDVVFPIAHGPIGEDGCLQGLLEVIDLPYVGAGVLASALAASKPAAKLCFRAENLPVAPEVVLRREALAEDADVASRILSELGCDRGAGLVVKPASGGSAIGVQRLGLDRPVTRGELLAALHASWEVDPEALIERFVAGLEVTCGVLEEDTGPRALSPTLIHANAATWYDFTSRYAAAGSRHECPAPLPKERLARIQEVALAAFHAVGARDLARMDFVVPEALTEDVTLLEVNTLPGMTATSLFPEAAAEAGWSFPELCRHLAFRAHARARRAKPVEVPLPI